MIYDTELKKNMMSYTSTRIKNSNSDWVKY